MGPPPSHQLDGGLLQLAACSCGVQLCDSSPDRQPETLGHEGANHLSPHAACRISLCRPLAAAPRVERSLGSLQFAWLMLLICVLGDVTYTAVACLSSLFPFLAG